MQQDWEYLERRRREKHAQWLRSLSDQEAFAIGAELFELAQQQRNDSDGWKRLEETRRQEKIEIRLKQRHAFLKMDEANGTGNTQSDVD